jgi:hypothetical protein
MTSFLSDVAEFAVVLVGLVLATILVGRVAPFVILYIVADHVMTDRR